MGVDDYILPQLCIQLQLLVRFTQVQFHEGLPSLKCGKQILNFGYGVTVQLGNWINCHLKITTYTHTLAIALHHSYDWSGPVGPIPVFLPPPTCLTLPPPAAAWSMATSGPCKLRDSIIFCLVIFEYPQAFLKDHPILSQKIVQPLT